MANYTPGEAIMFCAIFVCLFALALLALARPLRMLCKCGISAVLGAFLGLPGVAGIFLLSFFL